MSWQETLNQLESGEVRAAQRNAQGNWEANVAVKEAILASFRAGVNVEYDGAYAGFVDKDNFSKALLRWLHPHVLTKQDQSYYFVLNTLY